MKIVLTFSKVKGGFGTVIVDYPYGHATKRDLRDWVFFNADKLIPERGEMWNGYVHIYSHVTGLLIPMK